jgi:hypothetical protein
MGTAEIDRKGTGRWIGFSCLQTWSSGACECGNKTSGSVKGEVCCRRTADRPSAFL